MKVLHVVEATTAGVGRHVLDLCVHMRRLGVDVTVACPQVRETAQQDTAFVDRLGTAGVPVVVVPMRYGIHPSADLRDYARLVRLIHREAYDVVHAHSSKAGVLGRLGARRCEVPVIVYTPNAFAFLGARNRLYRCLYRTIEQWLGQHITDALICVSRSEMALVARQAIAPPGKIVLVENAINASRFAANNVDPAAAKFNLGLDPARPAVGYVGRLARQKGIEYLIQAARRVVAMGGNAQFVLVGEGELDGVVRQMVAAYHLEDHVVMAGYRTDVPQVLAALDIFVLPSLYEGLPYTLMEAMAAGRAVITTDVMGNRDLIQDGETGLLVPPHDAHALAKAMNHLLSAPDERQRLGKMALAAIQSRPTLEQMTHQIVELYTTILESKRNGLRIKAEPAKAKGEHKEP